MPERKVAAVWAGRAHGPSALHIEDGVVSRIEPAAPEPVPLRVTVMPGVTDRHVHLGLVDYRCLAGGPVVEVHDLGWARRLLPNVRSTWGCT